MWMQNESIQFHTYLSIGDCFFLFLFIFHAGIYGCQTNKQNNILTMFYALAQEFLFNKR